MASNDTLRAPFPWFGGKRRISPLVWERFGPVANYVEPFFGSGAVLLGRPDAHRRADTGFWPIETVNDLDGYVSNFWRALSLDPEAVAHWADWPVNEADLHARHDWLLGRAEFRERMHHDADFYDVKIAGWWVWGLCQWIGSGWCAEDCYDGTASQQLPHLGDPGRGLLDYFLALADRLRGVRVCCGDWSRVLGPSPTSRLGVTGILLDPPYLTDDDSRQADLYGCDSGSVANDVRAWAIEHGDDPLLRIALCGYEGEHTMPDTWDCVAWKAAGGYGSQGDERGRANANRERVWFSPACLAATQPHSQGDLFREVG
jgi:hypothetical protein